MDHLYNHIIPYKNIKITEEYKSNKKNDTNHNKYTNKKKISKEKKTNNVSYKFNDVKENDKDQGDITNFYHEMMRIPKMKGVHFDARQKRWCAYGYKKKECFSVYRYGFLIARELAIRSRLKVQKRKNNLRIRKMNTRENEKKKRKAKQFNF